MNLIAATVQAATGCTPTLAALYTPHLADACVACGITTPQRLAAFLAQIGHESGSLKYAAELWGPTPAQARYEGRVDLGNVQAGDGQRFKGRGLIQVTGRFNYQRMRDKLRAKLGDQQVPDFETVPEALERPAWAAWSAAQFWSAHGCNELADSGDFEALTRRINGGVNGLADRMARWELAKLALDAPDLPTLADRQPIGPTPSPEPIEAPAPAIAVEPTKGPVMATINEIIDSPLTKFALAAVNPLLAAVPEFIHLFTDKATGATVPERNVAAVTKIVNVAQQALQAAGHDAPNAQAVAELVASDPAAKAVARDALMGAYYSIAVGEAGGGGIEGARAAEAKFIAPGAQGFWHSPVFWVTMTLIPLVYLALYAVLFRDGFSMDIKAMVLGAIFGGLLTGGIQAYFYGTSASSQRKTELSASQAQGVQ